jgi:RNA polymerase sigma-70 factor, ECF subfamily
LPEEHHDLILRAREGDLPSFQLLVEHYQRFVFAVAFRLLGSEEDARDAAQECFVRLWKNLRKYDIERTFSTWLYKITVNLCCDELRRARRRKIIGNDAGEMIDIPWQGDVEESLNNADLAEKIRQLAQGLKARQRTVFVLRDLQELELDEIADILNTPVATVKSNLYYARRNIRAQCEKLGYGYEM